MAEKRSGILEQLKYPLGFFGLSLLVVEGAFGAVLSINELSEKVILILSTWMGGLFLVSILVVAFLVYKVPKHIMLQSQEDLGQEIQNIEALNTRIKNATNFLKKLSENPPKESDMLEMSFYKLKELLEKE